QSPSKMLILYQVKRRVEALAGVTLLHNSTDFLKKAEELMESAQKFVHLLQIKEEQPVETCEELKECQLALNQVKEIYFDKKRYKPNWAEKGSFLKSKIGDS